MSATQTTHTDHRETRLTAEEEGRELCPASELEQQWRRAGGTAVSASWPACHPHPATQDGTRQRPHQGKDGCRADRAEASAAHWAGVLSRLLETRVPGTECDAGTSTGASEGVVHTTSRSGASEGVIRTDTLEQPRQQRLLAGGTGGGPGGAPTAHCRARSLTHPAGAQTCLWARSTGPARSPFGMTALRERWGCRGQLHTRQRRPTFIPFLKAEQQ